MEIIVVIDAIEILAALAVIDVIARLLGRYSAVEFLQLGRAGGLVWAVTITACIFFDGICVWSG